MRWSDTARVGLTVILAGVVLVAGSFWLRGSARGAGFYTQQVSFPNAQGIQEGAYVRVRGVNLGTVDRVELGPDGNARLTLRLRNTYRLQPEDSIRITGGLIGFQPPTIEVTPGGRRDRPSPASDVLTGDTGPDTDRMLAQGERLLTNLNGLSERLGKLADTMNQVASNPNLQRDLLATTKNFARVSEKGVAIAGNMERATARADRLIAGFQSTAGSLNDTLKRADTLLSGFGGVSQDTRAVLRETKTMVGETRDVVKGAGALVRESQATMQNAGGLVTDTRSALNENRQKLTQLFDTLNGSLGKLDATLTEAQGFLGDPQLRNDLRATAQNVREATENLKKVSGDIEGLTGDPKVQEDLRATITGLRDASEQAAETLRSVRNVLGGGRNTAKSISQRISETRFSADAVHGFVSGRTRLDFDATIPWSEPTFFRLGFYDFGESNRFNAQAGQRLRSGLWARYGFHASRLGVGIDLGDGVRNTASLDLYGVRNPRIDVRGNIPIARSLDLTLGLDNLQDRPDPVIGLRYRK